jgi:hypothetical protein
MPAIPLGLSAYKRADLPPVTLKNFFYEKTPANLEDQIVLMPRPRLKPFASVGDGPIRGLYRKAGVVLGRLLVVSGDSLYRYENGEEHLIGEVDGDDRLSAEGNASTVVLTCGRTAYTTDSAELTAIPMPDSQHVVAVDTLNAYFLFAMANSGRFYWSAVGGTTVDALDYATAESQPDALTTLKVIGDELWLIGRSSTEVWQPTGDLDLPFQRIGGRTFSVGAVSRDTVQKLTVGGTVQLCFVGSDGKVYRTAPNPARISDHGMEERLSKADLQSLYAFTYSWNGHDFYVLHIPGQGSFAYDAATGFWDEITSYGRPLFRGSVSSLSSTEQPLIGDDVSAQIYELTESVRDDGGEPVVFECSGVLENIGAPVRCNNVILDVSAGLTPDPDNDPMIQMAYSADRGETFGPTLEMPLGRQGMRLTPVMWKRLGLIKRPGRIFRWRTTEPVTIRKAKFNEAFR